MGIPQPAGWLRNVFVLAHEVLGEGFPDLKDTISRKS